MVIILSFTKHTAILVNVKCQDSPYEYLDLLLAKCADGDAQK
jgi:hypothetical protein